MFPPQFPWRRCLIAVSGVWWLAAAGVTPAARQNCAMDVKVPPGIRPAYARVADRCEGMYARPVAARADLQLRGFRTHPYEFDVTRDGALDIGVIGWTPADGPGTLVVRSMRPRHYYQMDTAAALSAEGRYRWPTQLLREVAIQPEELAGYFTQPPSAAAPPVVWPIAIARPGAKPVVPMQLVLVLESEVELNLIEMTVAMPDGKPATQAWKSTRASYPEDLPILVPLAVKAAGIYDVSLTSTSREGIRGGLRLRVAVRSDALPGKK